MDAVTVWRLAGCRRFYIREPRCPPDECPLPSPAALSKVELVPSVGDRNGYCAALVENCSVCPAGSRAHGVDGANNSRAAEPYGSCRPGCRFAVRPRAEAGIWAIIPSASSGHSAATIKGIKLQLDRPTISDNLLASR